MRGGNLPGGENIDPVVGAVVRPYGDARPDTYAGRWIDRERGTWVFAFTDDPAPHLEAINALSLDDGPPIPLGETGWDAPPQTGLVGESQTVIDVVQARYSARELDELRLRARSLLARNERFLGAGGPDSLNRVSIDFDRPTDEDRRLAAEILPPGAVCVEGSASDVPIPIIDPAAPPTLLPPEADDPLVLCRGMADPVPLSALDAPLGFEKTDDPVAVVLRTEVETELGDWWEDLSWRLVVKTEERAVVLGGDPPVATMSFERTGDRWIWSGSSSGGCDGRTPLPLGVGEAEWQLDPSSPPPNPDDTELHVLVNERACTGASEIGDRLLGPEIRETDDEVVIVFAVIPLTGAHNCPGNPSTPVTVELEEPLGDRTLADGLYVPARPVERP